MRKTKACPKCDCKKLLNISAVADARDGNSTEASIANRFEGHSFIGNEKYRTVGKLQAVTCSDCGYTEHYVENPKELVPDGRTISWLTKAMFARRLSSFTVWMSGPSISTRPDVGA